MNYIALINRFWQLDEQQKFSGVETRLYFYLLHSANRSYWSEWFEYPDCILIHQMNISINSLKKAREQLVIKLLIVHQSGGVGKGNKSRYQLLTPNADLTPKNCQNLTPLAPILTPKVTPIGVGIPIYIKENNKNIINNNCYDRKKGFVFTGSDFD